ncbi:hypothetical protein GLOTRDRAFT_93427 [Gloeophyllum trabeum ATCC 11539]|uniref:Calcineurin-like phosphoesterase domain-containing protein n=1 Tax=Gloeophyllum trabeum (strain ATCC 11539 / FP-39264 / Madison 617) TaxID=670483 RepID=S7Q8Q2_GLOTA|nr:uncharacterized protein GLOTRDRAFT_93427 [Gloeophyllum trabeum ATCC 11539]EPQ55902.1 hypothetical protein GLOTRDRAFT_93427 [Gloeophyllum trabeum ATCC 11539]
MSASTASSIQIISDLHLGESPSDSDTCTPFDYIVPANAEYLALLGDVARTTDPRLFPWLAGVLDKFKAVFYVMGNHEPYGTAVDSALRTLESFADSLNANSSGHLVILNRTQYDVSDSLTILGCTLWSDLRHSSGSDGLTTPPIQDFTSVSSLTPAVYQSLHFADLAWLNSTVPSLAANTARRIIVLTHHAPLLLGTSDPAYYPSTFDGVRSLPGYATDLSQQPCWHPAVALWAFGHTHWCCDFVRDGVRVYANQRGRRGVGFDAGRVVEV